MSTITRRARFFLAPRGAADGRRPFANGSGGLTGIAIALADMLYLWQRRLRDRDTLRQMTTAQLKDIGVSRADALQEAEKPFWRG